jgi:hypothetical protein
VAIVLAAVVTAVVVYVVVGHRRSHSTTSSGQPFIAGYLATAKHEIDFIQWTDANGYLSGSMQQVTSTGTPPSEQATNSTLTLSGTLRGSALIVTFKFSPETSGTLTAKGFTLDIPQADGTLAPLAFRAATAVQFNSAVTALQTRIAQSNTKEANAENAQQQRQAWQLTIDGDAAVLNSDLSSLATAESSLTSDVQAISGSSLKGQATDVATTAADEQKVLAKAKQPGAASGSVCSDASAVGSDASAVASDASGVASDATGVTSDLSDVRSSISTVSLEISALQTDEAALPGYQPANPPDPGHVWQVVAAANVAVAAAVSTANSDIDKTNAYVTAAYQDASAADHAGNCGPSPTPPSPVDHIS